PVRSANVERTGEKDSGRGANAVRKKLERRAEYCQITGGNVSFIRIPTRDISLLTGIKLNSKL
ncbi:MAG: hypothetical protein QOF64_3095, partial [Candidatus Binatota bacterium]|nr:hypothetical protein [Candidatus Binatota bacterium]